MAAEGLGKLLLSGHVCNPKLLSRLLLLWCNPITEDDTHLRHCLGAFFPIYAFANRCGFALNIRFFEQGVLPSHIST